MYVCMYVCIYARDRDMTSALGYFRYVGILLAGYSATIAGHQKKMGMGKERKRKRKRSDRMFYATDKRTDGQYSMQDPGVKERGNTIC